MNKNNESFLFNKILEIRQRKKVPHRGFSWGFFFQSISPKDIEEKGLISAGSVERRKK